MLPIVGAAIDTALKIIDKVIPDPAAKANAQLEVLKLAQAGEFKALEADLALSLGQIEVNKVEAAGEGIFKSGWRPSVGWACSLAFGVQFVVIPLGTWVAGLFGTVVVPPALDNAQLMALLSGLLGLGGFRTYEKVRDKA